MAVRFAKVWVNHAADFPSYELNNDIARLNRNLIAKVLTVLFTI